MKFIIFTFIFAVIISQKAYSDINETCLTSLEQAIVYGDLDYIKNNLKSCKEAEESESYDISLLGHAVKYDNIGAAKFLLKYNYSMTKLQDGLPLIYLVHSIEMAKVLIKSGINLSPKASTRNSAFFEISRTKNLNLILFLIQEGLIITIEDLIRSLDYYRDDSIINAILDNNKNLVRGNTKVFRSIDLYSNEGQTLALRLIKMGANFVHARTFAGRVPNGRLLIDAHIDHYVKDDFRFKNGGLKAIKFLLENGVDTYAMTSIGYLAITHAMMRPTAYSFDILNLFLDAGFKVEKQNDKNANRTFLMDIAKSYQPTMEMTKYWIKILKIVTNDETNFNAQDNKYYRTALHEAIRNENVEIALLLAKRTDLTLKDIEGETPLALAKSLFERLPSDRQKQSMVRIIRVLNKL